MRPARYGAGIRLNSNLFIICITEQMSNVLTHSTTLRVNTDLSFDVAEQRSNVLTVGFKGHKLAIDP